MTPEQMMGMIRAGHDVEHVMDLHGAESRAEFRAMMMKWADEGNDAARIALAHYDQAMRDLDSGIMGARAAWHSISRKQREVLVACGRHAGRLVRSIGQYGVLAKTFTGCGVRATSATIRNLCSRDLLAWDGMTNGGNEPEAAAVLTERGRFVLQHGPIPAREGPGH